MATLGFAILRRNLFEIDAVARRFLVLGIQGLAAAGAYLATLLAVESATGDAAGWTAATLFAVALLVAIPAAAQQGPARRGAGRPLPRGPLLPAERGADPAAAFARAPRGRAAAGAALHRTRGPRLGRRITAVAAETMDELQRYGWPGNIRELRNVIERALVMASGEVLRLPGPLRADGAAGASNGEVGTLPLAELVRRKKIEWIREALARSGGNQRVAAELLGLHRPSLTRMIRELGIRDDADPPPLA